MNSIQLEKNISLSNFTTWGIGGPAEWIAQPKNIEELKYIINWICLLYTSPSPRDRQKSRMPSSA